MLVDNSVTADSRVQKAARSAAAAGWSVVVLGCSPDTEQHTWSIGEATVRLLPVTSSLARRRHEFRRRWLIAPFAYPPSGIAEQRQQAMRAWRVDLIHRRAQLTGDRRPSVAERATVGAHDIARRATTSWVSFRAWQLRGGQKLRRRLKTPWDRAYTSFWRALMGDRSWRRLEPGLWDYELSFGSAIDDLAPDIIHANDFRMLGVGARAVVRARVAGQQAKLAWDAHEYLPGVKPWRDHARWLPAHTAYEREYAPYADAVITVSDELAEMLRREHRLPARPAVVLNAPSTDDRAVGPDIRELCGISASTPLIVYSGLVAPKRGVALMVEALAALPNVHAAIVAPKPSADFVRTLQRRARDLGVEARLHVLPYVPHDQVVSFLSGADVGVIPIQHWPNHEIALITKFFEYAHARLPIVVSDVRTMAATTRELGQGEVFRADDVEDFVRAVTTVLGDRDHYRAAYDRMDVLETWTWEAQAKVLDEVYGRLVEQPATPLSTTVPDVSVVVAVYNAMPYLTRCLDSLVNQSIGLNRIEIVAVDDGSTDDSRRVLERYANRLPGHVTVVHQPNSGGPASPSNRGLERARGRYVFFIGADDYLGPQALQRLVRAADEQGADVVAGRMVGINGRYVPTDIFATTNLSVDLFDSSLPFALSNTKLFRTELITRHGLRYREDLAIGSDQPFTIEACLRARRISVLSDYDYYYATRRRRDNNITYRRDHLVRLQCTGAIMAHTAGLVESGPQRDALTYRHFHSEVGNLLLTDFLDLPREEQRRLADGIAELVRDHMTDAISERLDVSRRLRIILAARGDLDRLARVIKQDSGSEPIPAIVDGGGVYAGYDGFRDPQAGLPDALFHITDDPAEGYGAGLTIAAIRWPSNRLEVTVTGSPRPDGLSVQFRAGRVPAQVRLGEDGSNTGAVFRATWPIADLVADADAARDKERWRIAALVEADGRTSDAALRVPAGIAPGGRLVWARGRFYRLRPTRNRDNHLALDIVPVTGRRVTDGLLKKLRQTRRTS
jgi:glycosyltransferase involved in cell wall biosynthesis